MPHISDEVNGVSKKNSPQDWDCGAGTADMGSGDIMGGNSRMEWSPCSVMAFRRYYSLTIAKNEWCMQGKEKVIQIVQQRLHFIYLFFNFL